MPVKKVGSKYQPLDYETGKPIGKPTSKAKAEEIAMKAKHKGKKGKR